MESDTAPTHSADWWLWLLLAVLWFAASPLPPQMEPDEARYAEIPREMGVSGDWIVPRLNGLQYLEKPPLQYWITAGLYEVFGVHDWTARAWAYGAAFLCLPLIFAWVRRRHGAPAAFAAVAVLATSPYFVLIGHLNLLDSGFTLCMTATVLAFAMAQESPAGSRTERIGMLCAWAAAGFAVLSKGIVVPVLAGLTLIGYSALYRDWRPWRRLHLLAGLPLFLLIAVPWFVLVSRKEPEFPRFFFLHEHFERFLTTVHKHGEPWWYFLPLLVIAMLPWLRVVPRALSQAWRDPATGQRFRPMGFLLVYCAVVLLFFSVSQSKLPPYILPMMPALAALAGVHVTEQPGALRQAAWIVLAIVAVTAGGLVVYTLHRYDAAPLPVIAWSLGGFVVVLGAVLRIKADAPIARNAVWLVAGSLVGWQCLLVAHGYPPLERSARSLVAKVRPQIDDQTAVYNVGQYRQSVPFYLGRAVTLVDYQGELEFGQQQEPGHNTATPEQFRMQWETNRNAIAFFDRERWARLSSAGLPGRVIGEDRYSIVVRR